MAAPEKLVPASSVLAAWHTIDLEVPVYRSEDQSLNYYTDEITFDSSGPQDAFRFRLKVAPQGYYSDGYDMKGHGAFVELVPPPDWVCDFEICFQSRCLTPPTMMAKSGRRR